MNVNTKIKTILSECGFSLSGVTRLNIPLSYSLYQNWIYSGHHSGMTYLKDHLGLKKNPDKLLKNNLKSAIVVALPYTPTHPMPDENLPEFKHNKIAKYALGVDYHLFFKERLQQVIAKLNSIYSHECFHSFTDSSPILERDLGTRAGLGWIGKNSCLINQKQGSYFLLGEIFTSLELTNDQALAIDFCGNCDRCIKACPTQAIHSKSVSTNTVRTIDPKRCISYWTIESKEIPPIELRKSFEGWLFGCDICQDVCPWNQKKLKEALTHKPKQNIESIKQELCYILQSSNKELQRRFKNTAIERAAGWKLKRNAIITATHYHINDTDLCELIKNVGEKDLKLKELSDWALAELSQS